MNRSPDAKQLRLPSLTELVPEHAAQQPPMPHSQHHDHSLGRRASDSSSSTGITAAASTSSRWNAAYKSSLPLQLHRSELQEPKMLLEPDLRRYRDGSEQASLSSASAGYASTSRSSSYSTTRQDPFSSRGSLAAMTGMSPISPNFGIRQDGERPGFGTFPGLMPPPPPALVTPGTRYLGGPVETLPSPASETVSQPSSYQDATATAHMYVAEQHRRRSLSGAISSGPYDMTRRPTIGHRTNSSPRMMQTSSVPTSPSEESKTRRRRGNLPKHVTQYLRAWLHEHVDHPYPSEDQKRALGEHTGLNMNQISNWFINARRRILAPQEATRSQDSGWREQQASAGGATQANSSGSERDSPESMHAVAASVPPASTHLPPIRMHPSSEFHQYQQSHHTNEIDAHHRHNHEQQYPQKQQQQHPQPAEPLVPYQRPHPHR
ncbi:Homeobox protein tos8 [Savitreella phatthalungensis]